MFSVRSVLGMFSILALTSDSLEIRVLVPSIYLEITSLATRPPSKLGRLSASIAGTPPGPGGFGAVGLPQLPLEGWMKVGVGKLYIELAECNWNNIYFSSVWD